MITGYNTDVRHGDAVLHVQTEDKGKSNPFIESLVYVGGQVLAAKRASYADLVEEGRGAQAIVDRMERQHRTVIAAIKQGKFDDKLEAANLGRQRATAAPAAAQTPVPAAAAPTPTPTPTPTPVPAATPAPAAAAVANGPTLAEPPPAEPSPSLDQVILEYLTSEADQEQLLLTVGGDQDLRLGQPVELVLRATSSKSGRPVTDARVQVRMISTVASPSVLAAGATGATGALTLAFDVPALEHGTAALIITAASPIGRAEIKHLL